MFGAAGNNAQTTGGGIFGGQQNTGGFGGTGMGLASTPSFNMGNPAGGMMGGATGGTIGTPFDRGQTKRGNENCWVQSINAMQVYRDKVI